MPRRVFALLCLLSLITLRSAPAAASSEIFAPATSTRRRTATTLAGPRPSSFLSYHVSESALRERLAGAPSQSTGMHAGIVLALPLPDGRLEQFRIIESPVLGAELARAHPELRTFLAAGLENPRLSGRVDLTPFGVRAIVFAPEGMALIDPVERGRSDEVMSYWVKDDVMGSFDCLSDATVAASAAPTIAELGSAGDQLRTFRLILMATGEYTQSLGGVPQALAQMTTSVNRINAIYERDAAVHFEMVQMMAFPNAATDPYPSTSPGSLLTRNQVVVDSIFGPNAYDITQVIAVTASNRGVSFRPLSCYDGYKGQSSVQGTDATSNLFVIKIMPHELGHTLGATHTQDATANRDAITPYEPALGWTIMTNPGDPASFSDAFFHVASLDQIDSTLRVPMECVTPSSTGNSVPIASAGLDYTIPRGTPFVLQGAGADADAGDALSYTWDEVDGAPAAGDLTLGPLFRWRPPTASPSRFFPALATVLSGVADPLEKLPTVDRLLHFRLVVRDNHPGAGGHAWDDMVVTVGGAPFVLTFPNGGNSFNSGQAIPVTWTVGGGSVAPLVNILLSTDGGTSWIPLAVGTPNDGAESVSYVTGVTSNACRIKVEGAGNIFYDVSNANFTIVGDATATTLSLLQTEAATDGIAIRWRFSEPIRPGDVTVERAEDAVGPWVAPEGERREEPGASVFVDRTVQAGRLYWYRLRAVMGDGQVATFGPINGQMDGAPVALAISALSPNPTPGMLRVDFLVPRAGRVRLRLMDVQGRAIATLADEFTPPGRYQRTWTAAGLGNHAPGLYFLRLDGPGSSVVRRVVFAR